MADTSVTKVEAAHAPKGEQGQKYLASGTQVAMRLWEQEPPGEAKASARRDYETVGYVIAGRAELRLEGQTLTLAPGDSWTVPKGAGACLPHPGGVHGCGSDKPAGPRPRA